MIHHNLDLVYGIYNKITGDNPTQSDFFEKLFWKFINT